MRRIKRSDGQKRSIVFCFVEGRSARRLAGDLEAADFVRKPITRKRSRRLHHLEMKVRHNRVARVSNEADNLAELDVVASFYTNAARLHVRIHCKAASSEVEDHIISVRLIQRNVLGILAGNLLGLIVYRGNHGGVSNG